MGDWDYGSSQDDIISAGKSNGLAFFDGLGDLGYTSDASGWCSSFMLQNVPLVWVTGNHDTDESGPGILFGSGGRVEQCPLPSSLGVSAVVGPGSAYGVEYYFDYPASVPLARFIFHAHNIGGELNYDYSDGSAHYGFVSDAIDGAKAAGLWTIVSSHKGCPYSGGDKSDTGDCDGFADLLFSKGVDLVLFGHTHTYGRTYQFTGSYSSPTIVDTDTVLVRGAGTVINVLGTGCADSRSPGSNSLYAVTEAGGCGFGKFTVTSTSITMSFVPVGWSFADGFSIGGSAGPQPPSTNPQGGCPGCGIVETITSNMFLLVAGGLLGLTTVLSLVYLRSRSALQQARRPRRPQRHRY